MIKVLVSGCLFGWNCRYDGKAQPCEHEIFSRWRAEGRLVPFCPEQAGELSTPRKPCEIVGGAAVAKDGEDFTAQYIKGAAAAVARAKEETDGVICLLKENSPSCGVNMVYDGTFGGKKIFGQGFAAQQLKDAGYAVFSENEIQMADAFLKISEKN